MNKADDGRLRPEPPFVWPEPRVLDGLCAYDCNPAFQDVALSSNSVFGVVTAITGKAVGVIGSWVEENSDLKARLLVAVYPTCSTRQEDLSRLLTVTQRHPDRLKVRIKP